MRKCSSNFANSLHQGYGCQGLRWTKNDRMMKCGNEKMIKCNSTVFYHTSVIIHQKLNIKHLSPVIRHPAFPLIRSQLTKELKQEKCTYRGSYK
jgi:hypothetical protein